LERPLEGFGGTLTPINPLVPQEMEQWLAGSGMKIVKKTGMRVFYDYLQPKTKQKRSFEDVFEMEQRFSREEPFLYLARYLHYVCEKA
jgi:S-adenosylmethionine-dependent methyltransferase